MGAGNAMRGWPGLSTPSSNTRRIRGSSSRSRPTRRTQPSNTPRSRQAALFRGYTGGIFESVRSRGGADLEGLPRRSSSAGRSVRGAQPGRGAGTGARRSRVPPLRLREIHHVMEPVAAAYFYAHEQRPPRPCWLATLAAARATFPLCVSSPPRAAFMRTRSVIQASGLPAIRSIIQERPGCCAILGKGSQYRSFESCSTCRRAITTFRALERSVSHAVFRSGGRIEAPRRASLEAEKIEKFIALIEGNAAYTLYKAVSEAKTRLSHEDTGRLSVPPRVSRWMRRSPAPVSSGGSPKDLDNINSCIDDALRKAALKPHAKTGCF